MPGKEKKRIIFYRIGAIGDIMHSLPLLKLVRSREPEASLEFMVGSQQVSELLKEACPYIDKVWTISHKGCFNKIFNPPVNDSEKELKESLKNNPADEFVFLHSTWLKACALNLRYFHAPSLKIYKRDDELSAVANYASSYDPSLRDALIADSFKVLDFQTLEISQAPEDYICVVPGVGSLRPHRAYPLTKWIDFIKASESAVKILGGPDEKQLSEDLDKCLADEKVENLIGQTSLLELARILKAAKHLYSCDTGILHIAAALGVPSTAIFSITSEKRFGPFNPYAQVLRSQDCQCQLSDTNVPKHCMHLKDDYAQCMWKINLDVLRNEV